MALRLSEMAFMTKFLITDYRDQKSKNGVLRAFLQNCVTVGPFFSVCFFSFKLASHSVFVRHYCIMKFEILSLHILFAYKAIFDDSFRG